MSAPPLDEVPLDDARCELPLGVHAVATARHFIEKMLPGWGATPDETATASLLASELVTNAVLYGHGACALDLRRRPGVLRIAVSDGSAERPHPRTAGNEPEGGLGLQVIEQCALAWGVQPDGAGKIVWCDLSLEG